MELLTVKCSGIYLIINSKITYVNTSVKFYLFIECRRQQTVIVHNGCHRLKPTNDSTIIVHISMFVLDISCLLMLFPAKK